MHTYQPKNFRDRPQNIDNTGRKKRLKPKQPKGKWYNRRLIVGWFLILFLVLAPFIKIGGEPFMLFDIAHRRFSLFGVTIWAQDSFLLAMIMLVLVVSIVLFTVAFGRIWCGWACPQTLFMELVFRPIEYLFDGNLRQGNKKKKTKLRVFGKHLTFFLVAILITHVFIYWFTGPKRLLEIMTAPISENYLGLMLMFFISVFYYWIYAFFREQVCTMICPYGRMQGVLLDSKSISVIYDYKRGEPRGASTAGDCIDCKRCISVCPTGIDIKNGSQLECVNCTACIDECNIVMKRLGKPENLIRFDSFQGIETGKRSFGNARTYGYSVVLLILFIVLAFTIAKRNPIETSLLRVPGTIYQEVDDKNYSNIYNLKIINKTNSDKTLNIELISPLMGNIQITTDIIDLNKRGKIESVAIIKIPKLLITKHSTPITIGIYENEELLETYTTNFVGP